MLTFLVEPLNHLNLGNKIIIHKLKPIGTHNYFVYIITNRNKTVLYIGVTNDLAGRIEEHKEDSFKGKRTYAGKYNCYYLLYYEHFDFIEDAIDREKEIKGWLRKKKENLINTLNPDWEFLNDKIEE